MILEAKLSAARAAGRLSRRAGRGGGTSIPGKLLLRLEPRAIGALSGRLRDGCAVVSATNGKTTTAALTTAILQRAGRRLVRNATGANMAGGVASSLLDAATPGGRLNGDLGLFEVDEFWLRLLVADLRPRALLLGNLFRDQLDRYGELDAIADRWAEVVADFPSTGALVLNADDPLVADLGRGHPGTTYFGVADDDLALPGLQHAADSKHCRHCGAAYVYDAVYLAHLGRYHCPSCGRRRPDPTIVATRVVLDGTRGARFRLNTPDGATDVSLPLPGLYNVYNAVGAAALALGLGARLEHVVDGLRDAPAAFGRAETVHVGDRDLSILLVKNPAGANEVLRTLALEPPGLQLLGILNDGVADGRDVSWIWDADFEVLAERVGRVVCAGSRAPELALRLKYAGVPEARLEVEARLGPALDRALDGDGAGTVYALPTYTAMLALREELVARGAATSSWL